MSTVPFSNLPTPEAPVDSGDSGRKFFNTYYQQGFSVSGDVLDSCIAFFVSRGFDQTAATSISGVLISQAKIQNVDVFTLLDTLKTLKGIEISSVVKEILNNNRLRISTLGTKYDNTNSIDFELRNVLG